MAAAGLERMARWVCVVVVCCCCCCCGGTLSRAGGEERSVDGDGRDEVLEVGEKGWVRVGVAEVGWKSRRRFMQCDEREGCGSRGSAVWVLGWCRELEVGVVGCGCGCGRLVGVAFLRGEGCPGMIVSEVAKGGEGDRWCLLGVVGGERVASCSSLGR